MNLIPFNFNGHEIRVVKDHANEPWFVAKDIADDLGYSWAGTSTIAHVPEQWRGVRSVLTPSGNQQMAVLSEQSLYFFLGRSDKPGALPLQMWVAGEVIPSIRKTGSYQRPMTPAEQLLAQAQTMVTLERQQAEQQVALERVEHRVEELSQTMVWDHCPQNCQSLTRIKAWSAMATKKPLARSTWSGRKATSPPPSIVSSLNPRWSPPPRRPTHILRAGSAWSRRPNDEQRYQFPCRPRS